MCHYKITQTLDARISYLQRSGEDEQLLHWLVELQNRRSEDEIDLHQQYADNEFMY